MAMIKSSHLLIASLASVTILMSGCDKATAPKETVNKAAMSISKGDTALSVKTLADRIIKQQDDLLLFDIRNPEEFSKSHIKTAKQASVMQLLSEGADLPGGKDLVIYSTQSDKAAQVVALMRSKDLPAFYLAGGYDAWSRQMTDATGDAATIAEAHEMAKQQAVSCWFEGDYVATAGLVPKTPAQQPQSAGYTPPLEPVTPAEETDALGLGLGLGLGPEDEPAPSGQLKLNIGEGC